ncbi:PD-(D/E)XK nuclease family protein [Uliginosibacterium gangwonense]|uniref:PD-(D/E)XK nuclease family protein n=1 Tax=Uliginosibacterium gangwonense TaxID=392736 RepID=UPI0003689A12|nr:PD-(D/E)XK nuclease family protein [Uliginosibacterium gangwonense]
MSLLIKRLAPDAKFLSHAAALLLDFAHQAGNPSDLSAATLILPNLKLAQPLSQHMVEQAGSALLLPRMQTFSSFVEPWVAGLNALPDSRRQLVLHALLRGKGWFDEALLWDVVAELIQLFDALTEASVSLPIDEGELLAKLEAAFELHDSASLAFEAKLVNTLWLAEAQGRPSRIMARLLASRMAVASLQGPLVVMAEHRDYALIEPMLNLAAERVPVLLMVPDRTEARDLLAHTLAAVWPQTDSVCLHERMADVATQEAEQFLERVKFIACENLESLGQAVADQVLAWLHAGKRDIALVAADRLAARRARALLERKGVLVLDETGWKMATTRAAAVVDAWLEVLASDAYHRAVVDLLRAPLVFADVPALQRGAASHQLEALIRERSLASGLDRLLAEAGPEHADAAVLLLRLREAREVMAPHHTCGMAEWLRRLEKSLQILGAGESLAADMAGRQWLEWLQVRMGELAGDDEGFSFNSWRTWFNRQMDAVLFRDESITSPLIMTHLAATRLRPFEAAIVIGADSEHMAPPSAPAWLSHAGVRRQLGLPGLELQRQQLREDLAGMLLAAGESVIAWQRMRRDEELMPAVDVAVLTAAMQLAAGREVVKTPTTHVVEASTEIAPPLPACPAVPEERVPERLSASAMQTLLACPYRYFARYVLRLAEMDELSEAMEKSDFGEQLHAILNIFHRRFPCLAGQDDDQLLSALETITEEAFAEVVARNFQDHAWRLRWRQHLASYIHWQREREAQGWRWVEGEVDIQREHELGQQRHLRLQGRIDRSDRRTGTDGEETAVLDYKSRSQSALKRQVADPDDTQLAFYALLKGTRIGEAAYVALDDETVAAVSLDEPESRAEALQDCITMSFVAMYEGQGMPAHGAESACVWCEMRGICRKEWLA